MEETATTCIEVDLCGGNVTYVEECYMYEGRSKCVEENGRDEDKMDVDEAKTACKKPGMWKEGGKKVDKNNEFMDKNNEYVAKRRKEVDKIENTLK